MLNWLNARQGRVVAWGWCLHLDHPLTAIELDPGGGRRPIRARFPLPRDDVATLHAGIGWARASGFFLLGWLPDQVDVLRFYVLDIDGNRLLIHEHRQGPSDRWGWRQGLSVVRRWSRHVQAHIGAGRLQQLYGETLEWSRRLCVKGPERLEVMFALLGTEREALTLIIDHNMGGGANRAREETIATQLANGRHCLLLYPDIPSLGYRWELRDGGATQTFASDDLALLEAVLGLPRLDEVLLNNVVGFHDPLDLIRSLTAAAERKTVRLSYALHDYFPICPSYPLIGRRGRFCDLPDVAECARCIAENDAPFMDLVPRIAIPRWRMSWQALLSRCERITAFSQSSVDLLRRGLPKLSMSAVELRPHADTIIGSWIPVAVESSGPLHLGIVGHITHLKGAELVAALVDEIGRRRLPIRITVFGTLEHAVTAPCLTVLGPYQLQLLPRLIRESGANLFFFPSIWPETFSFVVQELMRLCLPVAAYRLGAPAERLARYPGGRLLDALDAPATLDALIAFHADLVRPREQVGPARLADARRAESEGPRMRAYDPAEPLG